MIKQNERDKISEEMKQFEENQKMQRQLAIQNHVNRNKRLLSVYEIFNFFLFRLNRMRLKHMKKKKKQKRAKQFLMKILLKIHYRVNYNESLINIDV